MEVITVPVKYIFMDIVDFTQGRSVEAQCEIIERMNSIVKDVIYELVIIEEVASEEDVIFIPTGDGICIALIKIFSPYDIHFQIALSILKKIGESNKNTIDEMKQFQIRIGLNENLDNLITDINGKTIVAGDGINMANRIMCVGDGGNIFVGQSVYNVMKQREKYMNVFEPFTEVMVKKDKFIVYQFKLTDCEGLNINKPLRLNKNIDITLSKEVAYYFKNLILLKDFNLQKMKENYLYHTSIILAWFMAYDEFLKEKETDIDLYELRLYDDVEYKVRNYDYYNNRIDKGTKENLCSLIINNYLEVYKECFRVNDKKYNWHFLNKYGEDLLKNEYPEIWNMTIPKNDNLVLEENNEST